MSCLTLLVRVRRLRRWMFPLAVSALTSIALVSSVDSAMPDPVPHRQPPSHGARTVMAPAPTPRPVSSLTPTATPVHPPGLTPAATLTPTPTPERTSLPKPTPTPAPRIDTTPTPTAIPGPTPTRPPAVDGSPAMPPFSRELLSVTNDARASNGLARLAPDASLTRAAQEYASELARYDWFDHTGPNGTTMSTRAEAAGYTGGWLAEVLYVGAWFQDPIEIVGLWLDSPGHRSVVLNGQLTSVGVGCAGSGEIRWCVGNFGGY
jgi:uncharacterized protein YkwD